MAPPQSCPHSWLYATTRVLLHRVASLERQAGPPGMFFTNPPTMFNPCAPGHHSVDASFATHLRTLMYQANLKPDYDGALDDAEKIDTELVATEPLDVFNSEYVPAPDDNLSKISQKTMDIAKMPKPPDDDVFDTIAKIDERIAQIEDKMIHETLSLEDEKMLMLEIVQLKNNKSNAATTILTPAEPLDHNIVDYKLFQLNMNFTYSAENVNFDCFSCVPDMYMSIAVPAPVHTLPCGPRQDVLGTRHEAVEEKAKKKAKKKKKKAVNFADVYYDDEYYGEVADQMYIAQFGEDAFYASMLEAT